MFLELEDESSALCARRRPMTVARNSGVTRHRLENCATVDFVISGVGRKLQLFVPWLFSTHTGCFNMANVTLSASPMGNGFQAMIAFSSGVSMSSSETYPTESEALTAAASRLLDMPSRIDALYSEGLAPNSG